jgi:serine/threonine protein phosphatase PrpC
VEAYGKSDLGCVRQNNEDRILIDKTASLCVVCDGMGGHRRGEVAAELVIDAIKYFISNSIDRHDVSWPFGYDFELSLDANRLVNGIRLGNRQVWRQAEQTLENSGMGSTITAVLINEGRAVVSNVGDTRAYLLRDHKLQQLSTDDTILAVMLRKGVLSTEQAAVHPMRNVLTQAMGSQETVNVHIWEGPLMAGDKLLVCTDGLYSVVPEPDIQAVLAHNSDIRETLDRLMSSAIDKGAPDNVSGILIYQ